MRHPPAIQQNLGRLVQAGGGNALGGCRKRQQQEGKQDSSLFENKEAKKLYPLECNHSTPILLSQGE
jgi:hypothetical protein